MNKTSPMTWIKRTIATTAILAPALMLTATEADAGTATDTFIVSTTVTNGCTMTAADITFPAYIAGPTTPALTAWTTFALNCGAPTNVTLTFTPLTGTATGVVYHMDGPAVGDILDYHLCLDAACTQQFTSATPLAFTTGAGPTLAVQGTILAGQTVNTGAYAQTVTADLVF